MPPKSIFSYDDRKNMVESIENLKNNDHYLAIFTIISSNKNTVFTQNSNGVFLDLTNLTDKTLTRINRYLNKINHDKLQEIHTDNDRIPCLSNDESEKTYKLSNYEKNIIKQRNFKKNESNNYKEIEICSKKKKNRKLEL